MDRPLLRSPKKISHPVVVAGLRAYYSLERLPEFFSPSASRQLHLSSSPRHLGKKLPSSSRETPTALTSHCQQSLLRLLSFIKSGVKS
jgi:hypothetical protein